MPDPLRSSAPGWGWRSAAIPLLFLLCPSLLLSGSACPSGRQKAEEFGIFSGFQEEVLVVGGAYRIGAGLPGGSTVST